MIRRRTRFLLRLVGILAVLTASALLVLQLPSTQEGIFRMLRNKVQESTGLLLETATFSYRILPARLRASGVRLSDEKGRSISIKTLEIDWKWRRLLDSPPRLGRISAQGIEADPSALPQPQPRETAENTTDPWEILEFDSLDISGIDLAGQLAPVSFRLEDAGIRGLLISGRLVFEGEASHLLLEKEGRHLDLGRLQAELDGNKPHLSLRKLDNQAEPLQIEASAEITSLPTFRLEGEIRSSLEPAFLLDWWDPELAEEIQASGRASFSGNFSLNPAGLPQFELRQEGPAFSIAGLPISAGRIAMNPEGLIEAEASDPGWGQIQAALLPGGKLEISGDLEGIPAGRLLVQHSLMPEELREVATELRIDGSFRLETPLPPSIELLEAKADLELAWPDGHAAIDAGISGSRLSIRKCDAAIPGASMSLEGTASETLELEGKLDISHPATMRRSLEFLLPPSTPEFGGGPIAAAFQIKGARNRPELRLNAAWESPLLAGESLDVLNFSAEGPADALSWQLDTQRAGATLAGKGRASLFEQRISGEYSLSHFDLDWIPARLGAGVPTAGRLDWVGRFEYVPDAWNVEASLDGQEVEISGINVSEAQAELYADSERLRIDSLHLALAGGAIEAAGDFSLEDSSLGATLSWQKLQPRLLDETFPLEGSSSGNIRISGSLDAPEGEAHMTWKSPGMLSEIQLSAQLAQGRIRVQSEKMASAGGPLYLRADLPLGSVPRPAFLLPAAPNGPWTVNIIASSLRIAPLLALAGREEIPIDGSADLDLALQWLPSLGGLPQLQAEIDRLILQTPVETFHTEAPIRLGFDGEELVLGKTTIRGSHGELDLEGSIDLDTRHLLASAKGSLSPSLAQLAPIPLHMDSPMKIEASLDGPLDKPAGHLKLEEGPGLIVLRNPPLQIEELRLEASFADGIVDIDDGHARINGGEADLGGGWDPTFGQGLVTEFENLSFLLPNDILSRWDGAISIEPSSYGLATVVGDLKLLQGLWERPFDLSAAMRNEGGDQAEESDMAHLVRLDLEVYGRGGIHVNNNLGKFDLQWNTLNITGTAAEPRIVGDVHFLPGGTLNLPGKQVPIRRGLAQFTGDPMVDPLLEIVPDNSSVDVLGSPSSISSGDEAAGLAKAGLSTGLSAFLGLSNTTIRPEDIAADTETDTSTEFSIGQQLGQSTALFLTTDLRDSQRRTTLFQVWQLPYLPDLTIQAQTRTDTGESDLKLFKRFRWGGTTDDSARLEKIHFEGRWPISKLKLRSLSGLRPGQSWDPFLLFMARIRLEEALAKRGYPEARVDAESGEDPEHPEVRLRCETGRKAEIRFLGDRIPRKLRARARALYRFPPLESSALEDIRTLIARHLWAEGFTDAKIENGKSGQEIGIHIAKGAKTIFQEPEIEGLPDAVRIDLLRMISNPVELAAIRRNPRRADASVMRALAYGGFRNPGPMKVRVERISEGVEKLHLSIDPGPQAHLDEILLEGEDPLALLDQPDFPVRKGIPLDRRLIDRAISQLRKSYRSEGYTEIRARAFLEEISPQSWRLRLRLEPGEPQKILEVNFHGLRSMREKYLRRKLGLEEGSLFLLSDLDESISRISRFSPVERIDAKIHHTSGGVVIDLDVSEAERWTLEVGGGWNSDRGPALRLGIRDDDLLGRGLKAAFRSRWEKDFTQGRLILTLPPLPGGHFALGLNTSYTEDYVAGESEADLRLRKNTGQATLDATWQLEHGLFLRGYYRFTRTHLFEEDSFDTFPVNQSLDLGILGSQIIIDRLDDPFDPRSGAYVGLDLSWAGSQLGSDTENIRALLSSSLAMTSTSGWTWFQSLRLGAAHPLSGPLDPTSRFYAGGASTIRGFRRDSVGPSETLGDQIIYVGGGAMAILNEEIRFPLWQSLRGAVFVDGGQVWEQWSDIDSNFSAGAGVGLRWTTPIGPLWLDVAWPVVRAGTNSGARFSFGIGRTF